MFSGMLMKVSPHNFNWVLEIIPYVAKKNRWRVLISKKDVMKLPLKKLLKENTTLDNRISFKNTYMCHLNGKSTKENKRKTSSRHS